MTIQDDSAEFYGAAYRETLGNLTRDEHLALEVCSILDGVVREAGEDETLREESLWEKLEEAVGFNDFSQEQADILFFQLRHQIGNTASISEVFRAS